MPGGAGSGRRGAARPFVEVTLAEHDQASNRVAVEIVADADPAVVVVDERSPELAADVRAGGPALVLTRSGSGTDQFAARRDAQPEPDPVRAVGPRDTVLIMFTSGTTGRRKGDMLTSHNLAYGLYLMNQLVELDDRSVCSAAMPFFHVSGLGLALVATPNGARLLLERRHHGRGGVRRRWCSRTSACPAATSWARSATVSSWPWSGSATAGS